MARADGMLAARRMCDVRVHDGHKAGQGRENLLMRAAGTGAVKRRREKATLHSPWPAPPAVRLSPGIAFCAGAAVPLRRMHEG